MVYKSAVFAVLASFLGCSVASPLSLFQRAACNSDNLLRCFIDKRYSVSATAYCAALTPYTSTVATVTATTTETTWLTITASTQTDTISSTTIYTATVPSATVTVARDSNQGNQRRDNSSPPQCMTKGVTYPEARITSACSCINVPARTVSVTHTAGTQTVTDTLTKLITATVSTTVVATVSTDTTSGVTTITVNPPAPSNVIANPGFESGSTAEWTFVTSNPAGWTGNVVKRNSFGNNGQTWVFDIAETINDGSASVRSSPFTLYPGTWSHSFVHMNNVYPTNNIGGRIDTLITAGNGQNILAGDGSLGVYIGNGWYRYSYTFTVTAAQAGPGASLKLMVNLPNPGTPHWYFDDVVVIAKA